jgi:PAS domain S-box-containing protein
VDDLGPTRPVGDGKGSSEVNLRSEHAFDHADLSNLRIRYQELFDFALSAQIITDLRGIILEANHAAAALFGRSKGFMVGKPLGLLLSEGYRAKFYKCLTIVARGGSVELESRVGPGDGRRSIALRAVSAGIDSDYRRGLWWYLQDLSRAQQSEELREALLRRTVSLQEEERRRVSREIHDQLGQELTALTLGLKGLESDLPASSAARRRLSELQELAHRLGRQTHDIAFELRPSALDDLGLRAATEDLVRRWSERSGVEIGFHFACHGPGRFSPDVESATYRVIQESLNNVAKHAQASGVSVIIEQMDNHLMILVEDDGRGFDPETREQSGALGLLGMSERIALVGGSLQIESSPGNGTTVRARIPCRDWLEAREP